jgi:hypothetical protein
MHFVLNEKKSVPVVKGHEELRAERAVVHVPRPQEEGAQELQRHVVQLHVVPDHVSHLLDHRRLTPALWRTAEESCHIKYCSMLRIRDFYPGSQISDPGSTDSTKRGEGINIFLSCHFL